MIRGEPGFTDLAGLLITGSACLIALAALVLAVWQGYQQRRYNMLSVAPRLRINCIADDRMPFLGFVLSNCGFGPAVVKSFMVTVDGVELAESSLQRLSSVLSVEDILSWAFPGHDDVMKPGEDIDLFGAYTKEWSTANTVRIKAALKRIGVRVGYESLYGEPHSVAVVGSKLRSLGGVSLLDPKVDSSHNPMPSADG